MSRSRLPGFCVALSAIALSTIGVAAPPPKPNVKKACVEAHERGQANFRQSKLRLAREALAECAKDECPPLVRTECAGLLTKLVDSQPTVIFGARDASGHETAEAKVYVDNELVTERLDGKPIEIDPGEHSIRFVPKTGTEVTETIIVRQSEKDRLIMVRFAGEESRKETTRSDSKGSGWPTSAYLLGAVGLLGLTGFTVLGLTGLSKEKDLEACSPHCAQEDADAVKTRYLFADISLGLGVVALGAATWIILSRPSDKPSSNAPKVEAFLTPNAGLIGIQGRF